MSKKIRLLVILGVVAMLLGLLCSCNSTGDVITPDESTTAESTDATTTDPADDVPKEIKIEVVNGIVNIAVVRPDLADTESTVVKCAQNIRSAIEAKLGVSPKLDNDYVKRGEEHDKTTLEILVGGTTYDETSEALSGCSYGDYTIMLVGKKIVVNGFSDSSLTAASNAFIKLINNYYVAGENEDDHGSIVLPVSELARVTTKDAQLSALPVYDGGTYYDYYNAGLRVSDASCDEIIIKNATPETHEAYCKKLEANGYVKYTENVVSGNYFATYTNDKYTINTGYYNYETSERILIEPLAPATGLASENVFTPVTTSQITMIGMETVDSKGAAANSNGLNMLIRLTDGRFIIVDGGFNRQDVADKIVATMREQSKDYLKSGEKPVIAAWLITHAHGDHQGALNGKFGTIVNAAKVERFIFNFLSESERIRAIATYKDNWSATEGSGATTSIANAESLKDAKIYKAHVGQKFYIADCTLEVLYTIESFAPKACNALNTSSVVIKMTFENEKGKTTYLSTGDATGNSMQTATKTFGDYMKCDIVQVCHHGYTTWGNDAGVIGAYQKINASLVLWPQGNRAFPNYKDKTYNSTLFKVSNFKECYVAGSIGDTTVVAIPYTYGANCVTCTYVNNRSTKPITG